MTEIIEFDPWKDLSPELKQFMGTPQEAEALRLYEEGKQFASEIQEEAVQKVRDRIIGLAKIHFGEEAGKRFQGVVESGMTAEQYRNIKPQMPESAEVKSLRLATEALKADIAAQANSGHGFERAVKQTMDEKKLSKAKAMQLVARQNPDLHQQYLRAMNPGKNIQ